MMDVATLRLEAGRSTLMLDRCHHSRKEQNTFLPTRLPVVSVHDILCWLCGNDIQKTCKGNGGQSIHSLKKKRKFKLQSTGKEHDESGKGGSSSMIDA